MTSEFNETPANILRAVLDAMDRESHPNAQVSAAYDAVRKLNPEWLDSRSIFRVGSKAFLERLTKENEALKTEISRTRPIVEAYKEWERARAIDPTAAAAAFIEALANLDEAIEKAREKS